MSQIDKENAVSQESLEPTNNGPQWQPVSVDGFEDVPVHLPNQSQEDNVQPVEPTQSEQETVDEGSADEGGMAELIEDAPTTQEQEEVQPEEPTVEEDVIELDSIETPKQEVVPEVTSEETNTPEWVSKLIQFSQETGGGLEEYMAYTKDFDSLSDTQLLKEYYSQKNPSYTSDDIDLLIESKFGVGEYKEGEEMSKEDRLKLLLLKDEVQGAKGFLNKRKEDYYTDLKSGVQGAPEQYKEAVQFYANHQKQAEAQAEVRQDFVAKTNEVFEEFQGFPFQAGDKTYRLKVGNASAVKESQLDLNNVIGEFLDESGKVVDAQGWHKAIWAAKNADKLFNAGVEAGKALTLKERAKATKNPSYANTGQSQPPKPATKFKFLGGEE